MKEEKFGWIAWDIEAERVLNGEWLVPEALDCPWMMKFSVKSLRNRFKLKFFMFDVEKINKGKISSPTPASENCWHEEKKSKCFWVVEFFPKNNLVSRNATDWVPLCTSVCGKIPVRRLLNWIFNGSLALLMFNEFLVKTKKSWLVRSSSRPRFEGKNRRSIRSCLSMLSDW